MIPATLPAEPPADFKTFARLREHFARESFDASLAYLAAHPDAPDRAEAAAFLFGTALAEDLTREARPAAEAFLETGTTATVAQKTAARRVVMTALALDGEADAAIELLAAELAAVRRTDPSGAIDSATLLAAAVQRGDKPEAAAKVYEQLKRSFFLNPAVDAIVENRLARLKLLGRPMPAIGLKDLSGEPVGASSLPPVVLVDFWATNCPPCLAEMPQLRRLHADHQEGGFEVLGVSLDEDEEIVRAYQARSPLPWRLFVSAADEDATRRAFAVETIPANFLVGPDGKIARVDLHGADLRAEVKRLLSERSK